MNSTTALILLVPSCGLAHDPELVAFLRAPQRRNVSHRMSKYQSDGYPTSIGDFFNSIAEPEPGGGAQLTSFVVVRRLNHPWLRSTRIRLPKQSLARSHSQPLALIYPTYELEVLDANHANHDICEMMPNQPGISLYALVYFATPLRTSREALGTLHIGESGEDEY
ncbi:hypothetical protein BU17DRAFT_62711 [Hysterangium stoloniferum]|nr:hypothetical protein BU17DRAFT_62711 [Hysterangium stoloniferum]